MTDFSFFNSGASEGAGAASLGGRGAAFADEIDVGCDRPNVSSPNETIGLLGLRDILLRAAASLESLAQTAPAAALSVTLPREKLAGVAHRFMATALPKPLTLGSTGSHAALFADPLFADRFRPGEMIEVYAAASSGCKRLAYGLLLPGYKWGSVKIGGVKRRIEELRSDKYASAWSKDGVFVQDHDFADWFSSLLAQTDVPPLSPVRITDRSLAVVLPDSLSHQAFENAFRQALAPCALNQFVTSPTGLAHVRALGADPALGQRATAYRLGSGIRMSPATEIYLLRPRAHGDVEAVIRVCEEIILRHLGLLKEGA